MDQLFEEDFFKSTNLNESGKLEKATGGTHKYVKRTGTPGKYKYWYKGADGKLTTDKNKATAGSKKEGLVSFVNKDNQGKWDSLNRDGQVKFLHRQGFSADYAGKSFKDLPEGVQKKLDKYKITTEKDLGNKSEKKKDSSKLPEGKITDVNSLFSGDKIIDPQTKQVKEIDSIDTHSNYVNMQYKDGTMKRYDNSSPHGAKFKKVSSGSKGEIQFSIIGHTLSGIKAMKIKAASKNEAIERAKSTGLVSISRVEEEKKGNAND